MDSQNRLSILDVTSVESVASGLPAEVQHPPPTYKEPVFDSLAAYHMTRTNEPPPKERSLITSMFNPCRIRSRVPMSLVCPRCHNHVTSEPHPEVGATSWVAGVVIFLLGGVLGCCLLPFYLNITKNQRHLCPICKRTIDIFKPLGI